MATASSGKLFPSDCYQSIPGCHLTSLQSTFSPNDSNSYSNCLNSIALLQDLAPPERNEICRSAKKRVISRRDKIFQQGEPANCVFVLLSGRMKQTLLTSGGQEVIVRVKGPGEALNTLGLPFGKPHSVSSQALEPCIVLCWKAEEFESFTNRFPALQRNIAQMAAVSLRELEERYVELATAEVAPRLARMLIRMYQLTGASSGKTVRIGLSREELAQMTGTSLFTVSRLLAQWDAMGIVDTAREAVLIHNTRGLEEIATAF